MISRSCAHETIWGSTHFWLLLVSPNTCWSTWMIWCSSGPGSGRPSQLMSLSTWMHLGSPCLDKPNSSNSNCRIKFWSFLQAQQLRSIHLLLLLLYLHGLYKMGEKSNVSVQDPPVSIGNRGIFHQFPTDCLGKKEKKHTFSVGKTFTRSTGVWVMRVMPSMLRNWPPAFPVFHDDLPWEGAYTTKVVPPKIAKLVYNLVNSLL